MHYEIDTEVAAAADRVWAVLVDVERMPEWTSSMTHVELLDPGDLGVGSRVRIHQPRLPRAVWEVTELVPARSFTWTTTNAGTTTTATHTVEGRGSGTSRASLALHQTGLLAPLLSWLIGRLARRYVDTELAGLKTRAEAG